MTKDFRVSARVLAETNDRALVLAVLEPAFRQLDDRTNPASFRVLTRGQRLLLPVTDAASAIESGSFHSYLYYGGASVIRETVAALEAIGAKKAAKVFSDAIALFPGSKPPRDVDKRQMMMDDMPESKLDKALDKLDKRFYALVDKEIFPRAAAHIRRHPADFVRSGEQVVSGMAKRLEGLKAVVGKRARPADPAALKKLAKRGAPPDVISMFTQIDWTGGYVTRGDVVLRDLATVLALNTEGLAARRARAAKFFLVAETIEERNVFGVALPGCERGKPGSVWLLLAAKEFEVLVAYHAAPDFRAFLDEVMSGSVRTEWLVEEKKANPKLRWSTAALPDYTEIWNSDEEEEIPKLPTWKAGGPLFVARAALVPVLGAKPMTKAEAGTKLIRYLKKHDLVRTDEPDGDIWLDDTLEKAFKSGVIIRYEELPKVLNRQLKRLTA